MKILTNKQLDSNIIDWPVYMHRALELACNVINTSPNPRVGCVLLNGGKIVGEGWHIAPGQAHAEVMALENAGASAEAAIAFVTLEPCSHTGRTGPCADALIQANISQLVIAGIDPNPLVSGSGIEKLEAAGVEVTHLVDFEQSAREINPGFFKVKQSGMPYVRCKMAMSLDGRTALANGESKWISSELARNDVQKLRAGSSAVLTGIETVLADNPSLNVRGAESDTDILKQQPLRVILDSKLRTPENANILTVDGSVKIYTAGQTDGLQNPASNVEILQAKDSTSRVNLRSVLESLASDFDCNEILLEAGATLSGAFLKEQLIDELHLYIAPKLLGSDARALIDMTGLQSMSETIDFEIVDLIKIGSDIRLILKPNYTL